MRERVKSWATVECFEVAAEYCLEYPERDAHPLLQWCVDVATPASVLVELVRAARFADAPVASVVTARALAHPGLPLAVRREPRATGLTRSADHGRSAHLT